MAPSQHATWRAHGHQVSVVDDLSRGHEHDVPHDILSVKRLQETESRKKLLEGVDAVIHFAARREGDPASLVADSTKLQREPGWKEQRSSSEQILKDAWDFIS